jgi:hypothetical protein
MVDTILTPMEDATDADRVRRIENLVEEQNKFIKMQQKELKERYSLQNMEELKIRTRKQNIQQFAKNFGDFVPRYNNKPEDTLFIFTDILYYVDDEEIYKLAENLNDGVFGIATMHIPKHLDTKTHPIIFPGCDENDQAFIEGKVRIVPKKVNYKQSKYTIYETKMVMEMEGNDHTYTHQIKYPELRERRFTVLEPLKPHPFIIKAVVEEKIDTGATYYMSIKLIKITDYKYQDIITIEDYESQGEYEYYETLFNQTHNGNVETFLRETHKYMAFKALMAQSPIMIENSTYLKYIEKIVDVKGTKKTIMVLNETLEEKTKQTAATFEEANNYYVVRRKNGGSVDTSVLFTKSMRKIKNQYEIKSIEPSLINKINTKLTLAQQIDAQFIRSLISFVNKENTTLPIDATMSIISTCLYKVLDVETQIALMKQAGVTQMLNEAKLDKLKLVPTSFREAIFTGNLFNYLKIKICGEWLGFSDKQNLDKVQDFQ